MLSPAKMDKTPAAPTKIRATWLNKRWLILPANFIPMTAPIISPGANTAAYKGVLKVIKPPAIRAGTAAVPITMK